MGTVVMRSRTGLLLFMLRQDKVRGLAHGQAGHAMALAADRKSIENALQAFHALRGIISKVVRVPPQVIHQLLLRGAFHLGLDARDLHGIEKQFLWPVRAQQPAGGDTQRQAWCPFHARQGIGVGLSHRQISIQPSVQALPHRLALGALNIPEPVAGVIAHGDEALLVAGFQIFFIELVAGEYERTQLGAMDRGRLLCRTEIGLELLYSLSSFVAIVVRKSMRSQLLPGGLLDAVHQAAGKMEGIRFFVCADAFCFDVLIGRQFRQGIRGF